MKYTFLIIHLFSYPLFLQSAEALKWQFPFSSLVTSKVESAIDPSGIQML
jgi:hypothetical protein